MPQHTFVMQEPCPYNQGRAKGRGVFGALHAFQDTDKQGGLESRIEEAGAHQCLGLQSMPAALLFEDPQLLYGTAFTCGQNVLHTCLPSRTEQMSL